MKEYRTTALAHGGRIFVSLKQLWRHAVQTGECGVRYDTFWKRYKVSRWSLQDALRRGNLRKDKDGQDEQD